MSVHSQIFSGNYLSCIKRKYEYILNGFPISIQCLNVNYNTKLHGMKQ